MKEIESKRHKGKDTEEEGRKSERHKNRQGEETERRDIGGET